ncbi:P2X purinoceptor 4 [Bagarius yarrelli]|uniref:P2X purinoceptor 4 n=1 Tax=Bagarius yarrelli TaxID=175774 RepID=A0A556TU65_BAGYA|nr:P2X purinoceptor 4 [Bagarius yarrelli]
MACGSVSRCFFDYSTSKVLVIQSKKVGALNRLGQALVIAYIVGYVCVLKKGYQDTDNVISSVTTKVKGLALTNTTNLGLRIWDEADYIVPPQVVHCSKKEKNPGPDTSCVSDQDCKRGFHDSRRNGVQTGRCVNFSESEKTCEVYAWCPVEKDRNPPRPAMLADAENFTVLIKNNIRFPKFNFSKRNILPYVNTTYLSQCVFNRTTDPDCPIFRLRDIVSEANEDFQTMAVQGGVMGVQIHWNCDLDLSKKWCVPQYAFRRLDDKDPDNVAPGYNFRFAKYYRNVDGQEIRTLIKGYGIRFDVMVYGKAGKFNIIPTLLNIGAGLALLGLVNVLCDCIALNCMQKRQFYREQKYTYVNEFETGLTSSAIKPVCVRSLSLSTNQNATETPPARADSTFKVTMVPGDGVGPELMMAVKEVFKGADVPVEFEEFHLSEVQNMASEEKLDQVLTSMKNNKVAIKGKIHTPMEYKGELASYEMRLRKLGDGLFLQSCAEVAELYPKIKYENIIIDNCCMQLVQNPYQFDVLVMPNLYGNIIDNLAAGLVGGAGVVPGESYSAEYAVFETGARHPFAQAVGRNIANPTAMLLSAANMLRHLNLEYHSNMVSEAVKKVRTLDLGGYSTTGDFVRAVVANLRHRPAC